MAFSDDQPSRNKSPSSPPPQVQTRHGRQHSQGFFEPSLPSASPANPHYIPDLTTSQIAAQAAMQHQSSQQQQQQHSRRRSQTVPNPQGTPETPTGRRKPKSPPPLQITQSGTPVPSLVGTPGPQYQNGAPAGNATAAATAASAVYPRSALSSPGLPASDLVPPLPEKEAKQKSEKSKMKLFSKPKSIGISKEKDIDKKDRGLPSPNKRGPFGPSPLPRMVNASTTSLAETINSSAPSFYQTANNSSATLVPMNDKATPTEKHKHHFLSRQKHRLRDKDDHHHLQLSSASSNSRPRDPNAPQPLYSFAPSSPSAATATFAKSMSGLDLRHGGRALREKKKEEKASAAGAGTTTLGMDTNFREGESAAAGGTDWLPSSYQGAASSFAGPPMTGSLNAHNDTYGYLDTPGQVGLQGFGLVGMTLDDAWPFLKAKLLVVFEGSFLRFPIEDLNRLVIAHIQRCVQKRAPSIITEDLRDLLRTGFSSLSQTLHRVPDEALVPQLVEMWLDIFGTILPYIQAVFLPLDLEFKGTGIIMTHREAQDFWGALPEGELDSPMGDSLDVRRIVLISFRDTVILPRHDTLKAIFSRLSLENINGVSLPATTSHPPETNSPDSASTGRPGTAMSLDPAVASYNSQGSTLLGDSSAASMGGPRSRATSNTSSAFGNNSACAAQDKVPFSSSPPQQPTRTVPLYPPPPFSSSGTITAATHGNKNHSNINPRPTTPSDSNRLTERVGCMLQCVSVLASVQQQTMSGAAGFAPNDEPQRKMEELAKTLKHNWLGRGRTGRNRRGYVGTRQPLPLSPPKRTSVTQVGTEVTENGNRISGSEGFERRGSML
ncbi:MAG: hypothetical protein M1837_005858 [Sclerophora amabilis]|nr:MAG: hypothetical protein M1837_005858 [Sclerophora amabilis]